MLGLLDDDETAGKFKFALKVVNSNGNEMYLSPPSVEERNSGRFRRLVKMKPKKNSGFSFEKVDRYTLRIRSSVGYIGL